MEVIRKKHITEIENQLAVLSSMININNSANLTDINVFLEQDICGLLNLLYDYELVNMNFEHNNYPGIDLADAKRRIAVQITSNKKRKKIESTIQTFIEQNYFEKYDRLIILLLDDKPNYEKEFDTKGKLIFSKDKDIIDFKQIFKDIMSCDIEKLERIAEYLKAHIDLQNNGKVRYVTDPPTNNCVFYRGRSADENIILKWLKEGTKPYVIRGTGGIGKTELAKGIWKRMFDEGAEYGIYYLAWVPYQGSDLRLSICQAFLDVKYTKNIDVAWKKVNDFFETAQRSLLIFVDNIEKSVNEDKLLNSLNQYAFRTILTTREKLNIGEEDKELKVLSEEDCKSLFYEFYKLEQDDSALQKIFEKAGYLTVVIELLAKTAAVEEMKLAELDNALTEHGFDISEEYVSTNHNLLTKEDKIAEQINKLFSIVIYTKEQIELLTKISMFPAKEFSYENAKRWFGEKRRTPLNDLVNRGWLRVQENSNQEKRYWMHPVLAASIRMQTNYLMHDTCKPMIKIFTDILSDDNQEDIRERFRLMPFAASLDIYMKQHFCDKDDLEFISALGNIYIEMAEYTQAIELYKFALKITGNNAELKEYNVELLTSLGNAYKQYGDFSEARKCYNTVMNDYLDQINCKAENSITVYRDMGHIYKSEGDYSMALKYYNKALEIYQKEKYKDSDLSEKYLAIIYYGKGNVYRCAEDFIESEKYYRKAQEIYKDRVDESSFEWMLIYDNIGVCQLGLGNYNSALAYHNRALELQKKTYKNIKQPFMGLSYMYRGDVYMAERKYELAYEDYQMAFQIIQNSVGNNHPYMIRIRNHLAKYYINQKDYAEAEKIEEKALPFASTELGKIHPDTAELYNNFVDIYMKKDDHHNAYKYHARIKEYKDTILRSHPETLKLWMREAEYYLSQNNIQKAYMSLEYLMNDASDITNKAPIVERARKLAFDLKKKYNIV